MLLLWLSLILLLFFICRPGQYNLDSSKSLQQRAQWRNPKNIMLSSTIRDDPEIKMRINAGPSPATYDTSGSLIKPSFNVLLSDKYQ